ncbi:MAG TPA: hypothetical protein VG013_21365, partial [Gemmataceae bacterium]|nr:hypothetical protein [Gemmataceae bacterium]
MYSIRLDDGGEEPALIEMPEEYLEAVPAPDKETILRYLKNGGLEEILRASLTGGREQPRVWLTFT